MSRLSEKISPRFPLCKWSEPARLVSTPCRIVIATALLLVSSSPRSPHTGQDARTAPLTRALGELETTHPTQWPTWPGTQTTNLIDDHGYGEGQYNNTAHTGHRRYDLASRRDRHQVTVAHSCHCSNTCISCVELVCYVILIRFSVAYTTTTQRVWSRTSSWVPLQ